MAQLILSIRIFRVDDDDVDLVEFYVYIKNQHKRKKRQNQTHENVHEMIHLNTLNACQNNDFISPTKYGFLIRNYCRFVQN